MNKLQIASRIEEGERLLADGEKIIKRTPKLAGIVEPGQEIIRDSLARLRERRDRMTAAELN